MEKKPITYREKVEARYLRRGRQQCWMWDGSLAHGRPALNLRHVIRYIYQWERGPIPPGHILMKRDHVYPECAQLHHKCRHMLCVNPWHVEPVYYPGAGTYRRENNWDGTRTDHLLRYRDTQKRKKNDGHDRHPQGGRTDQAGRPGEGTGVAGTPVQE